MQFVNDVVVGDWVICPPSRPLCREFPALYLEFAPLCREFVPNVWSSEPMFAQFGSRAFLAQH
jgi:hypothetical protein